MGVDVALGKKLIKFGLNVAYYRKLRSMNQEELSELSGVSRNAISNIEAPNIYANPTLATIIKLAKALDITPSELLIYRDDV